MTDPERPRDELIQDYIDGRMGGRDLAAMAAYLLAHPEVGSEIETLRRQTQALKRLGEEILTEPIPERLRAVLRRRPAGGANGVKSHPYPKSCLVALAGLALWLS